MSYILKLIEHLAETGDLTIVLVTFAFSVFSVALLLVVALMKGVRLRSNRNGKKNSKDFDSN